MFILLTYLPVSKNYFLSQTTSYNVTPCTKLTFLITNNNAELYYCKLQLKKNEFNIIASGNNFRSHHSATTICS